MTTTSKRIRYAGGLTYIESLLAVLMLGVCLVPAMQAMTGHFARQQFILDSSRDSGCVRDLMETTISEPYSNLLSAAVSSYSSGQFSSPAAYSLPASGSCPQARDVFILRYAPGPDPFTTTSDKMLYVRVEDRGGTRLATLAIER